MRVKGLLVLLLVLGLLAGGLVFYACSSGGDDDDTADDDADDDIDDDTDDDAAPPNSIGGVVIDYFSEVPLEGALVEVLNNATGESFDPPITGISDTNGYVMLTGIPEGEEQVGIKVSLAGYKDTIQYNFNVGVTDEQFLCISNTTVAAITLLLGIEWDPAKGTAAGAVYWGDPTDENPIGCVEVTTDPPNDEIHYMNNLGMPSRDRDIDTPGNPQNGEGTNPNDGAFVSVNMDPGQITITANADGNVEEAVLPQLFADSVCIVTIYYSKDEYPSNPQGAWCTSK